MVQYQISNRCLSLACGWLHKISVERVTCREWRHFLVSLCSGSWDQRDAQSSSETTCCKTNKTGNISCINCSDIFIVFQIEGWISFKKTPLSACYRQITFWTCPSCPWCRRPRCAWRAQRCVWSGCCWCSSYCRAWPQWRSCVCGSTGCTPPPVPEQIHSAVMTSFTATTPTPKYTHAHTHKNKTTIQLLSLFTNG